MGSSYFGEPNLGNERSGHGASSSSTTTSSRKGKKGNSSSDKPKQPQRGLGVAQLEKIRLHSQMGSTPYHHLPPNYHPTLLLNQEDMRQQALGYPQVSSSPSYAFQSHQNLMMGLGEMQRGNAGYGDTHLSTTARWNHNGAVEVQQFAPPEVTRYLLQAEDESLQRKMINDWSNSQTIADSQELDLELRLSL